MCLVLYYFKWSVVVSNKPSYHYAMSVIRELDRMKQQFTIFRRISESSLALEWIEECMVKSNWWIHIQSSVDEGRLIAPTPPASPLTQFSEESWTSLSTQKFSMEIASPTVEDHILDFALLYRRNQNDGQLILLSEDVTLKIKCMAEVSSYLYNMLLSYYSTREMLGTHTLPHSFKHFH